MLEHPPPYEESHRRASLGSYLDQFIFSHKIPQSKIRREVTSYLLRIKEFWREDVVILVNVKISFPSRQVDVLVEYIVSSDSEALTAYHILPHPATKFLL
jgi:hypothetical protein